MLRNLNALESLLVVIFLCYVTVSTIHLGQPGKDDTGKREKRQTSGNTDPRMADALDSLRRGTLNPNQVLFLTQIFGRAPPAPEEVQCYIPVTEYIGGQCINWHNTGVACQSGIRTDLHNYECIRMFQRQQLLSSGSAQTEDGEN